MKLAMPSIKRIFYASSLKSIFECNNTIMGHLSHIVSYDDNNNNNNNNNNEQLTFHFLGQSTESFDNHLHVPRTPVRFVIISFVIGTSLDGALLSSALLQLQTEIIFLLLDIKKKILFIFIFFLLGRENIITTTRFKSSIVHCFYIEKKA